MTARRRAALLVLLLLAASATAVAGESPGPATSKGDAAGNAAAKGAVAEAAKKAKPVAETKVRHPRSLEEAYRILDDRRLSVSFEDVRLGDALRHLSDLTGVNLLVGAALQKDGGSDLRINLVLKEISAREVLHFVVRSHDLGVLFTNGVVQVTTRAEARGKPVLRLYSVAHLTFVLRDFPAPDLMLRPAGAERETEEVRENRPAFADADEILELLKTHTGEGTWSEDGVSASVMRDTLVVRQFPEVHREISRLLGRLAASR